MNFPSFFCWSLISIHLAKKMYKVFNCQKYSIDLSKLSPNEAKAYFNYKSWWFKRFLINSCPDPVWASDFCNIRVQAWRLKQIWCLHNFFFSLAAWLECYIYADPLHSCILVIIGTGMEISRFGFSWIWELDNVAYLVELSIKVISPLHGLR